MDGKSSRSLCLQGAQGPKGEKGELASDNLQDSLVSRGATEDQGLPPTPCPGWLEL